MGRQKGVPNKRSMQLAELCAKAGGGKSLVDQIYAMRPHVSDADWLKALQHMLRYCHPTLKSVELTMEGEGTLIASRDNIARLCDVARKASLDAATNHDPA